MVVGGYRLRTLREQSGWTQPELAEAAGVDVRTIQRIEAGKSASLHTIVGVAKALGVALEDLQATSKPVPTPRPSGAFLRRVESGSELLGIVDGCLAFEFSQDDPKDETEVELLAECFTLLQDYGDILPELDAGERVRATFTLQGNVEALGAAGFWIFAAKLKHPVRYAGPNGQVMTDMWPTATIRAVRKDNPEIIQSRGTDAVFGRQEAN